ncbi:unnamed protein product [Prorocentrum cordatum]|uniref:Uncharacterized protein n=1 Tax=Prorocentrum cordatum TaxID=2364126 RepID=A0ABN9WP18_9DINO|nr:unnamed protein product [Polarella glacialis]
MRDAPEPRWGAACESPGACDSFGAGSGFCLVQAVSRDTSAGKVVYTPLAPACPPRTSAGARPAPRRCSCPPTAAWHEGAARWRRIGGARRRRLAQGAAIALPQGSARGGADHPEVRDDVRDKLGAAHGQPGVRLARSGGRPGAHARARRLHVRLASRRAEPHGWLPGGGPPGPVPAEVHAPVQVRAGPELRSASPPVPGLLPPRPPPAVRGRGEEPVRAHRVPVQVRPAELGRSLATPALDTLAVLRAMVGAPGGQGDRPQAHADRRRGEARIVGHLMHLRPLGEMVRDRRFAAGTGALEDGLAHVVHLETLQTSRSSTGSCARASRTAPPCPSSRRWAEHLVGPGGPN